MQKILRIGTRDSELAIWQASLVKNELSKHAVQSELIFIKSDGDLDLVTPLYAMGVQGVFTKSLDAALVNNRIDIAVHSMKDVPVQLARGITQAAVLKRGSYKDLLIKNGEWSLAHEMTDPPFIIATSSIRRKAQWLHRYPNTTVENLRGNINTRLRKVTESNWHGAIFAAAGLERINLRPANSIELDWMLPAPAQGAIMVVCREEDGTVKEKCNMLNDSGTALCVAEERNFLQALQGGCSAPISALATIENNELHFKGNIFSTDGKQKIEIEMKEEILMDKYKNDIGLKSARALWEMGADKIVEGIHDEGK